MPKKTGQWTYLTYVESDTRPGTYYSIEARAGDGVLRCACHSFRFAPGQLGTPGKTCKHLVAYGAGAALNIFGKHGGTSSLKTAGETFTFRRAFSFAAEL